MRSPWRILSCVAVVLFGVFRVQVAASPSDSEIRLLAEESRRQVAYLRATGVMTNPPSADGWAEQFARTNYCLKRLLAAYKAGQTKGFWTPTRTIPATANSWTLPESLWTVEMIDLIHEILPQASDKVVLQFRGRHHSLLHIAVSQGNLPAIRRLLELGADPDGAPGIKHGPMWDAVAKGSRHLMEAEKPVHKLGWDMVAELARAGARLDVPVGRYHSVLVAAISSRANASALDQLLNAGANPLWRFESHALPGHYEGTIIEEGYRGLWMDGAALSAPFADSLLLRPSSRAARSPAGDTVLHVAVAWGRISVVEKLVETKPLLAATNSLGRTPLQVAAWLRREDGCDPTLKNPEDDDWSIPENHPCRFRCVNRQHCARMLQAAGAVVDVFSAAGLGWTNELEQILRADPRVLEARDRDGRSPLHWAQRSGETNLIQWLIGRYPQVATRVEEFFEPSVAKLDEVFPSAASPRVETKPRPQSAPLAAAGWSARRTMAPRVIAPQEFWSAIEGNDAASVGRLLVETPGYARDFRSNSLTVVRFAGLRDNPEILRVLASKSDALRLAFQFDQPSQFIVTGLQPYRFVAEAGVSPERHMAYRSTEIEFGTYTTPLHQAAAFGYLGNIKELVRLGYAVGMRDRAGFTPLHYAAAYGRADAVRWLLSRGADPNDAAPVGLALVDLEFFGIADVGWVPVGLGKTPLYFAGKGNHTAVVEMLLKAGASPYRWRRQGDGPLADLQDEEFRTKPAVARQMAWMPEWTRASEDWQPLLALVLRHAAGVEKSPRQSSPSR